MSSELYEVISLAARYLFSLLGVLIVLRAFLWLRSDHLEKRRRLRHLPDTGMIGELVVLDGAGYIQDGTCFPVPWEGILGFVRSCDVVVPCIGIRKRHLSFSFEPETGLFIHPFSGCEASVDGTVLNCRTSEKAAPMVHGSCLKVGPAVLRLRIFAGLDRNAGFGQEASSGVLASPGVTPSAPVYPGQPAPLPEIVPPPEYSAPVPGYPGFPPYGQQALPENMMPPASQQNQCRPPAPGYIPVSGSSPAPVRRRRSDRWEEDDWSE